MRRHDDLFAALPGWLLARVAVGLGFVVAVVAADELRPGDRPLQVDQGLFAWDAAFYRDIADDGYGGVAREGLRFFPLLPLAARLLSVPLLGHVGLAMVIIVNGAALIAGVLLYRLVVQETGDREGARRAALFLALLPPAAVLVLGYAESVLLALALGVFLCIRGSDRWLLAAGLGLLAGLCRPMGMVLALPVLIEAVRTAGLPAREWRALVRRAAAVAAPVVGCAIYLLWVEREHGDWQLPLRLQNSADLRGGWANPLATVADGIRALGEDGLGEGLHVPWIALFAVLLVVVWRRLPSSYGAYSTVLLVAALSGHTLGSFERYGLVAFPLVMALALLLRDGVMERVAIAGAAATLTAFSALLFLGAFVP